MSIQGYAMQQHSIILERKSTLEIAHIETKPGLDSLIMDSDSTITNLACISVGKNTQWTAAKRKINEDHSKTITIRRRSSSLSDSAQVVKIAQEKGMAIINPNITTTKIQHFRGLYN